MPHIVVRLSGEKDRQQMEAWLKLSRDGHLYDKDVLGHDSSFSLTAMRTVDGPVMHLPVQQPLMLESAAQKPGLGPELAALALTRLVEYTIGEAYRRDVGEIYFLTRDADTARFAQRHHFKPLTDGLQVYRLNLLETFGS